MSKRNALHRPKAQSAALEPQDSAYPKPVVVEAPSGTLSPIKALPDGVQVQVSYPSMTPGDVIALTFNGDDTFVPQLGTDQKTVYFSVSASHIGKALGKTVSVEYKVNKQEKDGPTQQDLSVASETLNLTILPLMEGDLKMPKITDATESTPGKLDLSKLTGDAEFVIDAWPFIAEGQLIWLDMISETSTQHLLTANPVTSNEATSGVTRSISRAILEAVRDGSLLEFAAKVQLDGSGSATGAQNFPALKLLLQHAGGGAVEVTENFEGHESGQKPVFFDTNFMTFTGSGQSLVQLEDSYKMRHRTAFPDGYEKLVISLKATYSKVVLDAYCNSNHHAILICQYEGGVQEVKLEGPYITTYPFEHPNIRGFEIHGNARGCVLELDNFILSK